MYLSCSILVISNLKLTTADSFLFSLSVYIPDKRVRRIALNVVYTTYFKMCTQRSAMSFTFSEVFKLLLLICDL